MHFQASTKGGYIALEGSDLAITLPLNPTNSTLVDIHMLCHCYLRFISGIAQFTYTPVFNSFTGFSLACGLLFNRDLVVRRFALAGQ